MRIHPWILAAGVVALCIVAIGGAWWYRSRTLRSPAELIGCLPRSDAVRVYLDVGSMRDAGLLDLIAGSRAAEEPEYKEFVEQSGFDYRRDMDRAAAYFAGDTALMVIAGRFDWQKLGVYATNRGGACRNSFCQLPASQPGRSISFYPLRAGVLAIAVSPDKWAASNITERRATPELRAIPDQPLWLAVPGSYFRDAKDLPSGTRAFASALGTANELRFSIGPKDGAEGRSGQQFQIRAEVFAANAGAASALAGQLIETTELLNKMMAREKVQPNPDDLSGILAGGTFRAEASKVICLWPMPRLFLEKLAGGKAE